jgi:hypothetical protein
MGLPISRSIIASHGGRLWAIAKAGSGGTFQFTVNRRYNSADGLAPRSRERLLILLAYSLLYADSNSDYFGYCHDETGAVIYSAGVTVVDLSTRLK